MTIIYYNNSIPNDTIYFGEQYGIYKNGVSMKNDIGLLNLIKRKIGWNQQQHQWKKSQFIEGRIYQIMEIDTLPSFKGGYDSLLSYINKRIKYPEVYDLGIGEVRRITCQLIIGENGDLLSAKIVDSPDSLLNDKILNILKLMPKWFPGKLRGKAVNVEYYLPIIMKR
jgi:hypothetical protein